MFLVTYLLSLLCRKHIEVHGRPSAAVFLVEGGRAGRTFYLLSWQVQSSAPILEYRLLYRRISLVSAKDCLYIWLV
jgi:hypothetical protein